MKKTLSVILSFVFVLLALTACLSSCGVSEENASAVVGTWASNEAEGMTYTFNADGTGKYDLDGEITMSYTYKDTGSAIEITYQGMTEPQIWTYTLKDNILTMTDTDTGTVLTYTKK